jgi:hypothetical protein
VSGAILIPYRALKPVPPFPSSPMRDSLRTMGCRSTLCVSWRLRRSCTGIQPPALKTYCFAPGNNPLPYPDPLLRRVASHFQRCVGFLRPRIHPRFAAVACISYRILYFARNQVSLNSVRPVRSSTSKTRLTRVHESRLKISGRRLDALPLVHSK